MTGSKSRSRSRSLLSRPRSSSSVEVATAKHRRLTSNNSAPASSSSSSSGVDNNWVTRSPGHAHDDVIDLRGGRRGDVTLATAAGRADTLFTHNFYSQVVVASIGVARNLCWVEG